MSRNAANSRPVIVKRIVEESHGGHHGGAWKVAYADFVTAMMAFFLLMWLLGATTEKQRKALADYFAPTLVASKQDSAGSDKLFGGDSITSADKYPHAAGQTGTRSMTIPKDAEGGPREAEGRQVDAARFNSIRRIMMDRLHGQAQLRDLQRAIRFTDVRDGLRIDLVDNADFAMFALGTAKLTPQALRLVEMLGVILRELPNGIIIRGHTDAARWTQDPSMSNWQLSVERADATRKSLALHQVEPYRFTRIEGVADREPFTSSNPFDPSNRRMSITLTWSDAVRGEADQD